MPCFVLRRNIKLNDGQVGLSGNLRSEDTVVRFTVAMLAVVNHGGRSERLLRTAQCARKAVAVEPDKSSSQTRAVIVTGSDDLATAGLCITSSTSGAMSSRRH